jgi:hypothetical protein
MSKKTGMYIALIGVALELIDMTSASVNVNPTITGVQTAAVSLNRSFSDKFHLSYALIAVGGYLWLR